MGAEADAFRPSLTPSLSLLLGPTELRSLGLDAPTLLPSCCRSLSDWRLIGWSKRARSLSPWAVDRTVAFRRRGPLPLKQTKVILEFSSFDLSKRNSGAFLIKSCSFYVPWQCALDCASACRYGTAWTRFASRASASRRLLQADSTCLWVDMQNKTNEYALFKITPCTTI